MENLYELSNYCRTLWTYFSCLPVLRHSISRNYHEQYDAATRENYGHNWYMQLVQWHGIESNCAGPKPFPNIRSRFGELRHRKLRLQFVKTYTPAKKNPLLQRGINIYRSMCSVFALLTNESIFSFSLSIHPMEINWSKRR